MLFKRDGSSIKFCFVGLNAAEEEEITKLITENGGEIYNPIPDRNIHVYRDQVLRVNYINACLKQGKLLEPFAFSARDLQSLVRRCSKSFVADNDEARIHVEHNYATEICEEKEPASNSFNSKLPTLPHPALLIVLVPFLDDLPLVLRLPLSTIYSKVEESKRKISKQNPPTPPFLIIRRWAKETENQTPAAAKRKEKNLLQTDDKKLALQQHQISSIIESERTTRGRSRVVRQPAGASGSVSNQSNENRDQPPGIFPHTDELDDTPLSIRLRNLRAPEFDEIDDSPLSERLERLRTSKEKMEESEDSDEVTSVSPTLRKRKISFSSDDDSTKTDDTVRIVVSNGGNERLTGDKKSLKTAPSAMIDEDSYDSEKTVLWDDFRSRKRANTYKKEPSRCIDNDSTDPETVLPKDSKVDRQKKFGKTKEFPDSTNSGGGIRTNGASALTNKFIPLVIWDFSSDDTEYEADTELDEEPSNKAATNPDVPGSSKCTDNDPMGDRKILESVPKVEPQELQNNRSCLHNSSTTLNNSKKNVADLTRSNDVVILISDDDSHAPIEDNSVSNSSSSRRHIIKRRFNRAAEGRDVKIRRIVSLIDSDSSLEDETASNSARIANSIRAPIDTKTTSDLIERRTMDGKKRNPIRRMTRNFSRWEQKTMIKYLVETQSISMGRGNEIWKQMRKDGFLKHRTYQSLNNHFRKSILPKIHEFRIRKSDLEEFQELRH